MMEAATFDHNAADEPGYLSVEEEAGSRQVQEVESVSVTFIQCFVTVFADATKYR